MVVCVLIGVETVVTHVLHVQAGKIFTAVMITGTLDDALVVETMTRDTVNGSPANCSFSLLWLAGSAGLVDTAARDTIRRRRTETTDWDLACLLQEAQSRRTLGVVFARVSRGGQRDAHSALSGRSGFDECASLGSGTVSGRHTFLGANAVDAKARVTLLIGGTDGPSRQAWDFLADTFL